MESEGEKRLRVEEKRVRKDGEKREETENMKEGKYDGGKTRRG